MNGSKFSQTKSPSIHWQVICKETFRLDLEAGDLLIFTGFMHAFQGIISATQLVGGGGTWVGGGGGGEG